MKLIKRKFFRNLNRVIFTLLIISFFLAPYQSSAAIIETNRYIVSDGRYALLYQRQGAPDGSDKLLSAVSGYIAPGQYNLRVFQPTPSIFELGRIYGRNVEKGDGSDRLYIQNLIATPPNDPNDDYEQIFKVAAAPWMANASKAADQAYVDEFQRTYNDPAVQEACHGETDPNYWNCLYDAADKAGDAAHTKTFNEYQKNHAGECWEGWFYGGLNVGNCLAQGGYWFLWLLSWLLTLVGTLFGLIINKTVVEISKSLAEIGAIKTGWTAFRDLANITFIFILLFISIATILRLSSYDAKKLLIKVVIAALLINFSLFFTKVVIDSSNILTLTFYDHITLGNGQKLGNGSALGDAFMEPFGLQTIAPGLKANDPHLFAQSNYPLALTIFGAILILLATFVFVAACILFVIRFVILIILMVLSPLAFAASILPGTSSHAKKWWSTLISESFFAPIFMIMIWFSLEVAKQAGKIAGVGQYGVKQPGFAEAIANPNQVSLLGIVFNFAIVIALLIASLIISKQMGATGGGMALNTFNGLRRATQGLIGRNTLGEIGRRFEERFAQSRFANWAPVDALRGITTRSLANAKYGSGTSRMEAYKHGQELAENRLAATYGKDAKGLREKLGGIANKDSQKYKDTYSKYQETLAKLTPHELENVFSRSELKGDALLLNAMTSSQRDYLTGEGTKLSGKEKDRAGEVWAHSIEDEYKEIQKLEKSIGEAVDTDITKGLVKAGDRETKIDERKNASKFYNMFRKNLRNFSTKDAELMYRTAPELFTDKRIAQFFSSNLVEEVKKQEWIGKSGKDKLREAKFHGLYEAIDKAKAAAASGDINEQTKWEKEIEKQLLGRNAKEMLMLDFEHRNSRFLQQHFSVQEVKTMNSRNQDDIEKFNVAQNLLDAIKRKEMTENEAALWKYWATSEDREAKAFFAAATRQHLKAPKWNENEAKGFVKKYKDRVT